MEITNGFYFTVHHHNGKELVEEEVQAICSENNLDEFDGFMLDEVGNLYIIDVCGIKYRLDNPELHVRIQN